MAIGPSGGLLKKVFNPAIMKKKTKAALGQAKSGGPGINDNPPKMKTDTARKVMGGGGMKLMNAR